MTNPIGSDLDLASLSLNPPAPTKESLGQQEFLELMVTQLQNQDPFKPLESGEFLGQLAQFGTVSGLAELKSSFEGLSDSLVSNQGLQAAGLVGRNVLVASEDGVLEEGGTLAGAVDLPEGSSVVKVGIVGPDGEVVGIINLGAQPAGLARFSWDGKLADGSTAEPGVYSFVAQFQDGTETAAAETLVSAPVESVVFGSRGFSVQLRGLGEVPFSAVREVGSP